MSATVIHFDTIYRSRHFDTLDHDIMRLVTDTANYLDGPGRQAAKKLPREVRSLFGAESLRLTGFLLKLAGWIVAQRLLPEDTATPVPHRTRLQKIPELPHRSPWSCAPERLAQLPSEFRQLVDRAIALHRRARPMERTAAQTL